MSSFLTALSVGTRASSVFSQLYLSFDTISAEVANFIGPFRPPQWNQANQATLTMLVANPAVQNQSTNILGSSLPSAPSFPATLYVFDSVLRAEHIQESVITLNPIQTGADIGDHTYRLPARLEVEIRMSDSIQSCVPGQWSDNPGGKSVSAYQTLLGIRAAATPVHISTRMNVYDNMLVTGIRVEESRETRYSAKILVTFTQLINATVQQVSATQPTAVQSRVYTNAGEILYEPASNPAMFGSSALPQTTGITEGGQIQAMPVPPAIESQHAITDPLAQSLNLPKVPGAGNWSSTDISGLANLLGGNNV